VVNSTKVEGRKTSWPQVCSVDHPYGGQLDEGPDRKGCGRNFVRLRIHKVLKSTEVGTGYRCALGPLAHQAELRTFNPASRVRVPGGPHRPRPPPHAVAGAGPIIRSRGRARLRAPSNARLTRRGKRALTSLTTDERTSGSKPIAISPPRARPPMGFPAMSASVGSWTFARQSPQAASCARELSRTPAARGRRRRSSRRPSTRPGERGHLQS
jgi:hypothetical protein